LVPEKEKGAMRIRSYDVATAQCVGCDRPVARPTMCAVCKATWCGGCEVEGKIEYRYARWQCKHCVSKKHGNNLLRRAWHRIFATSNRT